MARHRTSFLKYYDENSAVLESCIVDRTNHTIRIHKKTSAIRIHRDLADLFDDPEWIVEISPTTRMHDQLIYLNDYLWPEEPRWKLVGEENIIDGKIIDVHK